MVILALICIPIVAILVWGIVYDMKRRRDPYTSADPEEAARRARADTDSHIGGMSSDDNFGHE